MSSLISIIVPVYNVGKYLCQCLDSVIIQTYTNWELILIDDGSKDNSSTICDYYASKDYRIKVIHKSNTGVSDSRNYALDIVIGKYIIFMDADDYWCVRTALEQLLDIAEKNELDIVRGEYDIVDAQGILHCRHLSSILQIKYTNRLLTPYEFLEYAIHGEFFLWLCLFKREAINDLRFKFGQIFLEDMRFLSTLITQDLHCMYLPDLKFYAYRKNFQIEYYTSPLPKNGEQWIWNIETNTLTNSSGRSIPYLHFLFFKKTPFWKTPNYWKENFFYIDDKCLKGQKGFVIFNNKSVTYKNCL